MKSWLERFSASFENSGSSRYSGSSSRRVVVGWASSDDSRSKDIVAVVEGLVMLWEVGVGDDNENEGAWRAG